MLGLYSFLIIIIKFIKNIKIIKIMEKEIVIGADHAGYALKEKLKKYFDRKKIKYVDIGAHSLDKNDDYPDFAVRVGREVARTGGFGILLCGSGTGMAIAANKIQGVRAAVAINEDEVALSRRHNAANVICLNGLEYKGIVKKLKGKKTLLDIKSKPANFNKIVKLIDIFLKTEFEGGRHARRLEKIMSLER